MSRAESNESPVASNRRILVIDDDKMYRGHYEEVLSPEGYVVTALPGGQEALDLVETEPFVLVVMDLVLHVMDGHRMLEEIKRRKPSLDVVVATHFSSAENVIRAYRHGASDFVVKPFNPDELSLVIKRLTRFKRLFQRSEDHRSTVELYDACKNLATCLELERLFEMALEVYQRVVRSEAAVALFQQPGMGSFKVMARSGIGEGAAGEISKAVVRKGFNTVARMFYDEGLDVKITIGGFEGMELMVIPMSFNGGYQVVMVLGRDRRSGSYAREDTSAASFITGQATIAFENALAYKATRDLNYVDDMTGLFNYRYLELTLDKEIHKARFHENRFVLLFIDIDHFKLINDTYGHLVGRMALIEFGKVLKNAIRECDTLVRYGGDEFIVLAKTDSTNAKAMAERILKMVRKHRFLGREGKEIRLTASVGIAEYPHHARTTKELIDLADKAMYQGKKAGRDCVYSVEAILEESARPRSSEKVELLPNEDPQDPSGPKQQP